MIVFCTTCKGRAQHIKETLPQNLRDNPGAKFVLLDYNSGDDLCEWVRTNLGKAIHKGQLVIYHLRTPGPFKMAHAKNMAHRLGMIEGGDILVNLDADNFTGPRFGEYVARHFATYPNIFMWAAMVKHKLPRGISGRIAVSAKDFLKAGGYDERFESWSPDDKDFDRRLRLLGLEGISIDPVYLTGVRHSEKMRFREYPEAAANSKSYSAHYLSPCDGPIANFGRFGCGIVFRNFDFADPLVLEPLPTRIFGIGMHKTATTSLHHALEILGFDSAHWKSAHWAKRLYNEMEPGTRSLTVEKSYAICDLPITLLYRQLDVCYPGSKFILTTRDESKWIESVRAHWDYGRNSFRAAWDTDPFTHKLHRILYGGKGFNYEVMLARYRQHNEEVRHYFRNRPNDLLEMPMDSFSGADHWYWLCKFLDRPVPSVPYPNSYAAY